MTYKKAKTNLRNQISTFYFNLGNFYTQHKYPLNHVWNSNEIRILIGQQSSA